MDTRSTSNSARLDGFYSRTYRRLHSVASHLLCRERPGHTFQATALIHEMFLKFGERPQVLNDDEHFCNMAARVMRQVLIDHSRRRRAQKRSRPEPEGRQWRPQRTEHDIAVRQLIARLRQLDPGAADTLWRHSAEGASFAEIARLRGVELWRVRADYAYAFHWMSRQLGGR